LAHITSSSSAQPACLPAKGAKAFLAAAFVSIAVLISGALLADSASAGDGLAAMRASFRITDGETSGTCFLVAGDDGAMIVTAAHVMNNMKRDVCTLILRKQHKDGSHHRHETPVTVRVAGKP